MPERVGGWWCLDFANTVGPRRPRAAAESHEYLPGYRELAVWGAEAGLLTPRQANRLTAAAEQHPDEAAAVHHGALRLREATYEVFSAVAQGGQPPAGELGTIQEFYLRALRHAHLAPAPGGLDWHWPDTEQPLERVLWPVVRSAVELARSGQLHRIKQCPGGDDTCRWLFLDTSKSATRRWCSMRTCGSRVKSRRQVARRRTTDGNTSG